MWYSKFIQLLVFRIQQYCRSVSHDCFARTHRVEIGEQDEFFILGCDGIWDCLTNEKAVAYVRSRIDTLTPTQIGVEMLNDIISEDPRATQGIGGDNMTVMIVDLQPNSRSWRQELQDEPERIMSQESLENV